LRIFAKFSNRVYTGYSLCKHCICH
jgi:hypothetical protein